MIVDQTIAFVKERLNGAESGHDWFHIQRVYNNAMLIAKDIPEADLLVVQLGALLHDIADSKFYGGDESIGPKIAFDFLNDLNVNIQTIDKVIKIIENISYKGGFKSLYNSLELDIVQDADRLDAIGAIGIARAFNYGGFKNREIYNPDIEPNFNMTKEEYKSSTAPTINHFYEKLLKLKNLMNTDAAKKIASSRHDFMELFLKQFYQEWSGEK